jgi:hypothetical protein
MDNRERTRLLMAHMRQARRAKGLCVGCGLVKTPAGERCPDCRTARTVKDQRSYTLDNQPSTRVA